MIDTRALLLKAGQRIGANWIAMLVRALQSMQVTAGNASQIEVRQTELGQDISLSRPIPGILWGNTTEGPILPRDGSGYWMSNVVTLYVDLIDEDGEPYSELGTEDDTVVVWNRTAQTIPGDKDVAIVEISGRLFALAWDC
jgi:hypothetical protein